MARKSRKIYNTADAPAVKEKIKDKAVIYPTAIYARLSNENNGKEDNGASIENQIDICREYISRIPDLQLIKVYKDNGWTGTVMDRPSFNEMMEDAKAGIVKCIVVRDLSRFGRNYIETGSYIETILPEMGVRFVSVKEDFDSIKCDNDDLMVKLQNLINYLYAMDISRKVETSLHTKMKEGTFAWGKLPYGYSWNDDHSSIVPDVARAPFVKQIFQWKIDGVTEMEMCRRLTKAGAPKYDDEENAEDVPWNRSTVHHILINPVYIGNHVYGMTHSAIYKGEKKHKKPEKDWYVCENTHEAIISKEQFDTVRQMIKAESERKQNKLKENAKGRVRVMDFYNGILFCKDCGFKMYLQRYKTSKEGTRWNGYYYCSSSRNRENVGCSTHKIRKKELDECVLQTIQMHAAIALDFERIITDIKKGSADKGFKDSINNQIKSVSIRLNAVGNKRQDLYENYIGGILDAEEYKYAKSKYENDFEDLNSKLEYLTEREREMSEALSSGNKWINLLKDKKSLKKLSTELVDALIDRIDIGESKKVYITFKYKDVYDLTKECIEKIRGGEYERNSDIYPAFKS